MRGELIAWTVYKGIKDRFGGFLAVKKGLMELPLTFYLFEWLIRQHNILLTV